MTLEAIEADTYRLVEEAWRRGLRPEPQLSVSEWADRNRILPGANAEPGPWRTSRVPYLQEVMDCLSTSSPVERVVLMKGAQTGGTEAGLNAIGYWIAHAPGTILCVWPSLDMVRRNSRVRIEPLIDGTPALRGKIAPARAKDPGNTVFQKEFEGGALVMTGANSATGLRSLPARYCVMDEVDAFPVDAGGEGDPVALAIQRTATFRGRRKILLISTPTDAGTSRIEKAFAESDQRRFFVPCRHCGQWQTIKWANIRWPEGEPGRAFYACESCGGILEERDKPALLAAGEWRPTAPGDGRTAGFHLPGLLSPFETWGEIATEFEAVKRDPLRLRVWVNTKEGLPFEDRETTPLEPAWFMERLEDFGEALPEKVAVLTAGIDVQDDRLALEIVGWGLGEESWSLRYTEIWGNPAEPDVWTAVDAELRRPFDHSLAGPTVIRAACIDSGGHHTQTVYRFAQERAARLVWAIKGAPGWGVPIWPRRPPKPGQRTFAPFLIGVDSAKELVTARLRLTEPGAGFCHFPHGRDVDYFGMLTAERLVRTYIRGVPSRKWIKPRRVANEAFDCRIYATGALAGLTARGFRLEAEAKRIADLMPYANDKAKAARPAVIKSGWMER